MAGKTLRRMFSWRLLFAVKGGGLGLLGFEIAKMLDQFDGDPDEIQITLRKRGEDAEEI